MAKPSLSKVVHIPFIKYSSYVQEKYPIPNKRIQQNSGARDINYYDLVILDSHMFRGNDSSKNFYNQFMEEVISEDLRPIFSFLEEDILDLVFSDEDSPKKRNESILKISEKRWLNAYVKLVENFEAVSKALGKENEYYFGYMLSGLYESAVMSSYKMKDYHQNSYNKYFWHFSW